MRSFSAADNDPISKSKSNGAQTTFLLLPHDQRVRGRIIYTIFDGAKTTSEITRDMDNCYALNYVRSQLIRMHHLGLVAPIGVRKEEGDRERVGYYRDLIWTLTKHTREHKHQFSNCTACTIREMLLASCEVVWE
jgi:hypothetical protein